MSAAAIIGKSVAGGVIIGPGAPTVLVNGSAVSTLGDTVTPHGDPPHSSATIISSSKTVLAQGIGIVRVGDKASCGHSVGRGSPNVFVG